MEFWRASHARLHFFPWFFASLSSLGGRGGHLGIFTCLGLADCVFIVRPSSPSQLFCVTARRPGPAATLIPRLVSVSHSPLPSPGAPTSFQQPNGFLGLVCLLFILQPAAVHAGSPSSREFVLSPSAFTAKWRSFYFLASSSLYRFYFLHTTVSICVAAYRCCTVRRYVSRLALNAELMQEPFHQGICFCFDTAFWCRMSCFPLI